jgi:hypothetical protein
MKSCLSTGIQVNGKRLKFCRKLNNPGPFRRLINPGVMETTYARAVDSIKLGA